MQDDMVLCRTLRTLGRHNAGEICGFNRAQAEKYRKAGAVEFVEMDMPEEAPPPEEKKPEPDPPKRGPGRPRKSTT